MKANFQSLPPFEDAEHELDNHATWLASFSESNYGPSKHGIIGGRELPEGFESYYTVDVLGKEFEWMNESFPKEKYTWYLWFESVFIVPGEMVSFLKLRWE